MLSKSRQGGPHGLVRQIQSREGHQICKDKFTDLSILQAHESSTWTEAAKAVITPTNLRLERGAAVHPLAGRR